MTGRSVYAGQCMGRRRSKCMCTHKQVRTRTYLLSLQYANACAHMNTHILTHIQLHVHGAPQDMCTPSCPHPPHAAPTLLCALAARAWHCVPCCAEP